MEKKKFSNEEIALANDKNLLDLATNYGLTVVPSFKNTYSTKEHSSLCLSPDEGKWNWLSRDEGGGPIQFVMQMENLSWVEAVKKLLNIDPNQVAPIVRSQKRDIEKEKEEFIPPARNTDYRHMFAYLIKHRGIDKDIVSEFVSARKLYENDKKSCVFVGMDKEGIPKYAAIRGTNTTGKAYKGEAANSDKSYAFSKEGSNNELVAVEAPIELLSYLSLAKRRGEDFKSHILSIGGVSFVAVDRYLNEHENIDTINVATNNDEAGHRSYLKYLDEYSNRFTVKRVKSQSYDWNNDLTAKQGLSSTSKEFELPIAKGTLKQAFDKAPLYLMNELGIEDDIIIQLFANDKLKQSIYGNCLFISYDKNNEPKAAYVVSSNTIGEKHEGFVEGSDPKYPFSIEGDNDILCVFKNPQELLSYLSLAKLHGVDNFKYHCIAASNEKAIDYYLGENPNIKKIIFCCSQTDSLYQIGPKYKSKVNIAHHDPKGSEFSQDLYDLKETIKKNEVEESCYEEELVSGQ